MEIPVILVDDDELDRYIAKRQLAKIDTFGVCTEICSGDEFVDTCLSNPSDYFRGEAPVLILMDINMPGTDGFETIEKAQQAIEGGKVNASMFFMIVSSSDSSSDRERAARLSLVKGFISKPIDRDAVIGIRDLYMTGTGA